MSEKFVVEDEVERPWWMVFEDAKKGKGD